jgi:hypothetical protein
MKAVLQLVLLGGGGVPLWLVECEQRGIESEYLETELSIWSWLARQECVAEIMFVHSFPRAFPIFQENSPYTRGYLLLDAVCLHPHKSITYHVSIIYFFTFYHLPIDHLCLWGLEYRR